MRSTKIIATIGPATSSVSNLRQLAEAGVSICRMNFSHGDYAVHGEVIRNVRAVNREGYQLAIMLDTKGPEVRTGDVDTPIIVKEGDRMIFTSKPTGKEKLPVIRIDHHGFIKDAPHARCILIDNGSIEFTIESVTKNGVVAKAKEGGKIGSRRHVNLPGAHISLPSFTEKDWSDITFGVDQDVDFIATSFVRTGADIRTLRAFLKKKKSTTEIIAKIETPEAVKNIEDIIREADGIMVARGDLGAEVPFEDVPVIQDAIVRRCREEGKPVIVATHMLESMILSPMPTRAEVTDIAHAARSLADCTMLSGETTTGLYPFRAVDAMVRVLTKNERVTTSDQGVRHSPARTKDDMQRKEEARAACVLATNLKADAIVVMSRTGRTARYVSQWRPSLPIIACTRTDDAARKLLLCWGIQPVVVPFSDNHEKTVTEAINHLLSQKLLKRRQTIVVITDMNTSGSLAMTVQVRTLA